MKKPFVYILAITLFVKLVTLSGCANMIPPSGGPKDTLAPRLIAALPKDSSTNINNTKITLTFDEYVEVKDIQENLVVSPIPKNAPTIDYKLRNITIKLRDSLEPNTTYAINFGKSIKDVNEGNIAKDYTYVFSTGSKIDDNELSGRVLLAETGKPDSTLIVVLYRNLNDTAVIKTSPKYYTKLDGEGKFNFKYLPAGEFGVFVLPNEYTKRYDDSTKVFAFLNAPVTVGKETKPVSMFAYQEAKRKSNNASTGSSSNANNNGGGKNDDKRLKFSVSDNGTQDLLNKYLELHFNRKLKTVDSTKIRLTDTSFKPLTGYHLSLDSTATKLHLEYPWKEDMQLRLILDKEAVADSNNVSLPKGDTIKINTKKESEYGSLRIRFNNLDLSKHPVLQIIRNNEVAEAIVITQKELYRKLFKPGEYELRILFDDNQNMVWDAGHYKTKKQPEVVKSLSQKLSIRANWDNETNIDVGQ